MLPHDRIWIKADAELFIEPRLYVMLLFRLIIQAQEARTFFNGSLIRLGKSRFLSVRKDMHVVIAYRFKEALSVFVFSLGFFNILIQQRPSAAVVCNEIVESGLVEHYSVQSLSLGYFQSAQTILIIIVAVGFLYA